MAPSRRSGSNNSNNDDDNNENPDIAAIIAQQLQTILPQIVTQVTNNVNNANNGNGNGGNNGSRGRVAAMAMSWNDFKALMVEEFCPSNEMEKLENEYIAGLAPEIRGMLRVTQPTTIQDCIHAGWNAYDEAINNKKQDGNLNAWLISSTRNELIALILSVARVTYSSATGPAINKQEELFTYKEEMAPVALSDTKVNNDKSCSKTYLTNYETLKKLYDDLIVKLHEIEFKAATYKRGLATVEDQLVTYRKREVEFTKPENHEKIVKKSVRYAEMYRSQSPRGNQRNWNGQKSNHLGSDFVMNNKAGFVCGSFDHLKKDCIVLMRSGIRAVNTARPRAGVDAAKPKAAYNTTQGRHEHEQEVDTEVTTARAEVSTASPKVKTAGDSIDDIAANNFV
ncbi:hypothetical protein Tco_1037560 [Tanacetum coccineum]